ncbi:MAG: hypothetical protein QM681_00405 [Novosphingobium sp.]
MTTPWKASSYTGAVVPFAPVEAADDYLHPVGPDAHFTAIETNLYGFDIPGHDINCNIYLLWHHALGTMSLHVFVHKGRKSLPHQLAADYFSEHLYLPAPSDIADFTVQAGSLTYRSYVVAPLDDIRIEADDLKHGFSLRLNYRAAVPPVGRPGGKHFTQLMKTSGELVLGGERFAIDGHYMRDRSWGYSRPEEPELTPPYRWMTGWVYDEGGAVAKSFVIAWIDVGLIDDPRFGPQWNEVASTRDASGENKWESGGATPSLNLRSGWISIDGVPRPVVRIDTRTLFEGEGPEVRAFEVAITDDRGEVHRFTARTQSMIPKMYWQNLLVYMHLVELEADGLRGHGDLMDTYNSAHIRYFSR